MMETWNRAMAATTRVERKPGTNALAKAAFEKMYVCEPPPQGLPGPQTLPLWL